MALCDLEKIDGLTVDEAAAALGRTKHNLLHARLKSYAPRPNAPPAWRRLRVQELLLAGWSYKRIAAEMKIHWHTVGCHVRKIYKQHGVHGRDELARKLRVPLQGPSDRRRRAAQTPHPNRFADSY